jgi:hypothetical protein
MLSVLPLCYCQGAAKILNRKLKLFEKKQKFKFCVKLLTPGGNPIKLFFGRNLQISGAPF